MLSWHVNSAEYRSVPKELRSAGASGIVMMRNDQPAGCYHVPPTDALSLQLLRQPVHAHRVDHGVLWRSTSCRVDDLALAPARTALVYDIADDCRFLCAYIPPAVVEEIAPVAVGSKNPDFGRLHAGLWRDPFISALLPRLWEEMATGSPSGALFADFAWRSLIALLFTLAGQSIKQSPARGGLAPRQLNLVLARMADDLRNQPSLAELAAIADLSVKHFARAFKRSTSLAPHHWLLRHRVERAEALLADNLLSLAEVALACGYADQSHFGAAFRKATGVSPGRYRRERAR